jgi:hypothetical protein
MIDVSLAAQVIAKIFSGMFLTKEGMIVLAVFGFGGFAFWVKSKLES